MRLSEQSIHRPVATTLLWLAIMIGGIAAWFNLPIAALPSFNQPIIQVSASLPGASPETMASSVATILERQFSTISGLKMMTSTSQLGSTSITLEFIPSRDIDAAAVDVQAAIMRTQRQLPKDMTNPPSYRKVNPADDPVLFITIDSPSISLDQLNDYADNLISPTLSTLDGVAQVTINGQKRYAVRITVDPVKLASRDLSIGELSNALAASNSNTPLGAYDGERQTLVISANDQLMNAADFVRMIVATRNGQPVRLSDVATVADSVENMKSASWVNGKRAINLQVLRQPSANTVAVVDAVRAAIPRLKAQLPASVDIQILNDRSLSIRESIHDVSLTMLLTIGLVMLVILLFLRRLSATLIPSVSLPASLLGTFGLMLWFGYSLDNISLMGLTIAIGLVVDDAIVVLENIVRHIENGEKPFPAAIKGVREVGFTVISITVSLIAVFIPIFFMPGTIGLLFHEFAIVVTLAISVSALAALTIIPMLAARFVRHHHEERKAPLWSRAFESLFDRVLRAYSRSLAWTIERRWLMLLVALATCAGTVWLYVIMPKGFFPDEDISQVRAPVTPAQDMSWQATRDLVTKYDQKIRTHPAVQDVVSNMNSSGSSGFIFITLKPKAERAPMKEVLEELRRETSSIVGGRISFSAIQNLRLGGRSSNARYQYTLQSVDYDLVATQADRMQRRLRESDLLKDINTDAERGAVQAKLIIDRDQALALGVDMQSLRTVLNASFSERQVTSIYAPQDNFPVLMQWDEKYRGDESALDFVRVRAKGGQLIPVTAFARIERRAVNSTVNHQGQIASVTLSFNLAPGVTLSQAIGEVLKIKEDLAMPSNVFGSFGGDAAVYQDSQTSQLWLILIAIAVIYVVLGVLYESWIHPVTILAGIPSAAVGALLSLRLAGLELTFIAMVGILLLIGIVKKNAIMMIDFALETQRSEHASPKDAILTSSRLRFRPIMMTTLAAIMGALPIALGIGAGAELRQPMGVAIVGELIFSQLITLYITPSLFLSFDWLQHKLGLSSRKTPPTRH
ncbi:MAG: acriflavine resistance protein B [Candidatus Dactylopiibacterium carminicum]|uniref:AcrB/AcrD/AcrF family protein n=1 Tax=Candidatus Dactylopiibacterium carminicum TaxID=857335 RepID=A0A272EYV7_9RHOO|nr:efflux RND transporter permease subunit [Candidatus Dactylopiibacterium carminicum]KAF7600815.1 AcrB/AcrD/AcrF family protein [Candidatus Dactylopiibacterium carminicum]PAS95314.1 MAG: acriflavine resistance protein B [Candidatus Dactylopiibacterium carminicum]PAT00821.1 MAG: acriflavine resistance protein B [Candidatus Dactylopiibacterium carminicum]